MGVLIQTRGGSLRTGENLSGNGEEYAIVITEGQDTKGRDLSKFSAKSGKSGLSRAC